MRLENEDQQSTTERNSSLGNSKIVDDSSHQNTRKTSAGGWEGAKLALVFKHIRRRRRTIIVTHGGLGRSEIMKVE